MTDELAIAEIRSEIALERSAIIAARGFDIDRDSADLGEWELALWADRVTFLVHRREPLGAVVVDSGRQDSYVATLVNSTLLGFCADQVHRCQCGALNGWKPAPSVVLGG